MFERRSSRFTVEVIILVALAVSVSVAHLNRLVIAGVMLAGWLIVSLLEWATLRGEAHYGSGLPPRYYQPEVRLPPPLTLSESGSVFPEPAVADAPAHVLLPAMEPEPVIGGWSIPAPEEVVAPLEPVAYVPEAAPVWEAEVEVRRRRACCRAGAHGRADGRGLAGATDKRARV